MEDLGEAVLMVVVLQGDFNMKITELEKEFLQHSNWIEGEYGNEALEDAIAAWKLGKSQRDGLCAKKIRTIHKYLMHRINPGIAGQWRNCAVMIGGEVKKAKHQAVLEMEVEEWTIMHFPNNKEEEIKQAHIAFEKIHPFVDGNGRMGRILMNLQRLNAGLPILIIHEGEEQMQYYQWFK